MKNQTFYKNQLPHINFDGAIQFVTFRLVDSLPQKVGLKTQKCKETFLDRGYGSCILGNHANAEKLELELLRGHLTQYFLYAWVIMPNHVHLLLKILSTLPLWKLTKSLKAKSAIEINKQRGETGKVWQKESFDHFVRNEFYFKKFINYIEFNPVKAGLCNSPSDWRFSSAYCASVVGANLFAPSDGATSMLRGE